jgi:hypothetical protein
MNESSHRSQRSYFIPAPAVMNDWAPRDVIARKSFISTFSQYTNTRDPGFVCPELENKFNARAGIEGAAFSRQVHAYRRHQHNGRSLGVSTSAFSTNTPFASSCTAGRPRAITAKPAHTHCRAAALGTGTYHASNGPIHYHQHAVDAPAADALPRPRSRVRCTHDHSARTHSRFTRPHEREFFGHSLRAVRRPATQTAADTLPRVTTSGHEKSMDDTMPGTVSSEVSWNDDDVCQPKSPRVSRSRTRRQVTSSDRLLVTGPEAYSSYGSKYAHSVYSWQD